MPREIPPASAPPTFPKRAATKKVAKKAKRKATKKSHKAAAPPKKRTEVDPKTLTPDEAKKRVAAIYRLEKVVDTRKAAHALAKRRARQAKAELAEATDALEKEIRDQRFGPGPLFDPQP